MTSHCAWNTFFFFFSLSSTVWMWWDCAVYHLTLDCFWCWSSLPRHNWSIEQKQMTLAKQWNSLQTGSGPVYTSSHRNCLLIELQKFCSICLTLTDCISSFPVQCLLLNCRFFLLHSLASNCLSKLNYSLSLQAFPWLFNSLSILLASFLAWLLIPYISFTVTSPSKMTLPSGEAPFLYDHWQKGVISYNLPTHLHSLHPLTSPVSLWHQSLNCHQKIHTDC